MIATICLVLALVAAQLPERTWTISGRVTDRESGQPLPRARVSIYSGMAGLTNAKPPEMSTVTDSSGGYEFPGMPMGLYTVIAQPPPHVVTHLPQAFGHDISVGATIRYFVSANSIVAIKNSDVREINIALTRAVVAEGRVLSDQGDPMAGISVSLIPLDNGAPEAPPARLTDDRGAFRLFGAMPGRYRVCATAPAPASAQTSAPFRRSCYPHDSEVLELTTSNPNPVEIRMTRARVASVSGIALDASGAPLDRGQIQFVERGTAARRSLPLERTAGGRFVVRNVEPGNYEIVATLTPDSPLDSREREGTTVPVTVEATDIENVTVRTKRAARLSGIVVFDEGIPEKGSGNMQIMLRADAPAMTGPTWIAPTARVKEDLTFELGNLHETGRITVTGQPQGWVVKSVVYQGRDVANLPVSFETSTDPRAIEIHLTSRVAYVTGRALALDKRALTVLLLSADRNQWTASAGVVAQAAVRADGSFTVGPVVAGEYLILATTPQTFVEILRDPKTSLERVATGAVTIFLAENERQALTLYVNDK